MVRRDGGCSWTENGLYWVRRIKSKMQAEREAWRDEEWRDGGWRDGGRRD